MSLPIKPTPTIIGKDAERFRKRMDEVEKGMHKISDKERKRMEDNYEFMMAIFKDV